MHWFIVLLLCIAAVSGLCPWDDATLKPWSAASSWPGSKLPLMGQDVVIGAGMNILLDTTNLPAKSIRIEDGGRLVWANIDGLQLIGAEVAVMRHGSLWIGNNECPFTRSATIVLGGDSYSKIAEFGQIIVRPGLDGILELHDGTPRPFFRALNKRADYISGEASIPSNFNVSSELVPSWGTGEIPAPDHVQGAFRFICNPSHHLYDDPIVFPGKPGASHLHTFFGNTMANSQSTYQSLRTKGNSTCMSPLNRSAYWIPSMLDGKGNLIHPDYISIYYKRRPSNDTECQRQGKACVSIPRGLKYIFGFDMVNGTAATGGGYVNCLGPNTKQDHYPSLVAASQSGLCPPGSQVGIAISAPDCWDGKRLDSFNHRDHVSYGSYGYWGYYKCPDTHPYIIPTFTLAAWTTDVNKTFDWTNYDNTTSGYSSWHLSSDVQYSGVVGRKLTPGTTMHADWFGAWDDSIMRMWEENCIEKLLSCSGGDLGNGLQMKTFGGFSWLADAEHPRTFPIPAKPSTTASSITSGSSSAASSGTSSASSSGTSSGTSSGASSSPANPTAAPTPPSEKSSASSLSCITLAVAVVCALVLML